MGAQPKKASGKAVVDGSRPRTTGSGGGGHCRSKTYLLFYFLFCYIFVTM